MDFCVLVNKSNLLSSDYVPDNLIEIHEPMGSKLDEKYVNRLNKTAYAYFKLMQEDAEREGFEIFIDSSYRSFDYQKKVFDEYANEVGYDEALRRVALPGASEHQTGLAFDVISRRNGKMIEKSSDTDLEIIWLMENCYKYGYILRYPLDKEEITGFDYERWHYRFVGIDISMEMHDKNILTLEEFYLSKEKKYIKM